MTDVCVDDFGAIGDGESLDTAAIQSAIDHVSASGGGRVSLSPGRTYLAGTVELRSFTELHVTRGSTLRASSAISDYPRTIAGVVQMEEPPSAHSTEVCGVLVSAVDVQDVAITGAGRIDGSGREWITREGQGIHDVAEGRVFTVYFRDVTRAAIRDVVVSDGSVWTVRASRCDDLLIDGVTIDNDPRFPNSDGIDIDACRNVRIANCNIVAGDDAICLKATIESTQDGRRCENITITNCVMQSSSTAFLCGVECQTAIQNVVVSNCVIRNSNRGLAVRLHESGTIQDIRFDNIVVESDFFDERWWGHAEPIYVGAIPRHEGVGQVRRIDFSNITSSSPRGVFIYAQRPGLIDGVTISNSRIRILETDDDRAHQADLRPVRGTGFLPDELAAVRVHDASGVTVFNTRVDLPPSVELSRATGDSEPHFSQVHVEVTR